LRHLISGGRIAVEKWIVCDDKNDASVEEFDTYEKAKATFDAWVQSEKNICKEMNIKSGTKFYIAKVIEVAEVIQNERYTLSC
jgi:ribosomal protein L14E/L6E/L27E